MNERVDIVRWSDEAKADLKYIVQRISEKTLSSQLALNVMNDIIQKSKDITFAEQYQVDEYLGKPYRRMVVRHFKIIYKVQKQKEVRILQIFDTHQNPIKIRKG